jgi:hypothetical protein
VAHIRGQKVYKVLMEKLEGKRPLRRPRRRWQDGISMALRQTDWRGVDWIRLAQDRDRWRVMNLLGLAPQTYVVS